MKTAILYFFIALNGLLLGQVGDIYYTQDGLLYRAFDYVLGSSCTTDSDCGCTWDCLEMAQAE